ADAAAAHAQHHAGALWRARHVNPLPLPGGRMLPPSAAAPPTACPQGLDNRRARAYCVAVTGRATLAIELHEAGAMRTSPRALLVVLLAGALLLVRGCRAPASGGARPYPSAGASAPSARPPQASARASPPPAGRARDPAAPPSAAGPAAASPQAAAAYGPQPLDPPVKVRVGVAGVGAEASLYYAMDQGYLKDEGIEVEL